MAVMHVRRLNGFHLLPIVSWGVGVKVANLDGDGTFILYSGTQRPKGCGMYPSVPKHP